MKRRQRRWRTTPEWAQFEAFLADMHTLHRLPEEEFLRIKEACRKCKTLEWTDRLTLRDLCTSCTRQAIRDRIQRRIRKDDFSKFLGGVGMLVAGFAFADAWNESLRFLNRAIEPEEPSAAEQVSSYETKYMFQGSLRASAREGILDLIRELFLIVRDEQSKRAEKLHARVEDFYYMLHEGQTGAAVACGAPGGPPIHYVPIGEILFMLFVWRFFCSLANGRDSHGAADQDTIPRMVTCRFSWAGRVLPLEQWAIGLQNDWSALEGSLFAGDEWQDWSLELERLLLFAEGAPTPWLTCVRTYLEGAELRRGAWSGPDARDVVDDLAMAAWKYVRQLAGGDVQPRQAVSLLEQGAPCPLLGVYFWITLDRYPATYFACPVWTTARYSVRYRKRTQILRDSLLGEEEASQARGGNADTVIAGIALCMTAPLACDPTIAELDSHSLRRVVRRTDPEELRDLLVLLSRPLVELLFYDPLTDRLRELRGREAMAAVMARNLSHNIGSHVISSSRLHVGLGLEGKVWSQGLEAALAGSTADQATRVKLLVHSELDRVRDRLGTFHAYVQARLDFIARVLTGGRDVAEPMFLRKEIFEHLLSQSVLLGCLLDDLDYRGESLGFRLRLPRGTWSVYAHDPSDGVFHAGGSEPDDILVGVPGGFIGRHAFYALIENILRNAARHGASVDGSRKLVLSIELAESSEDAYSLLMWCNRRASDEQIEKVRSLLQGETIDESGQLVGGGHGLREMNACAAFIRGDLRVVEYGEMQTTPRRPLEPFRASAEGEPESQGAILAYLLAVRKPRLVGVWSAMEARRQ